MVKTKETEETEAHHPRLESQELLLTILKRFKSQAGITFTIDDILVESHDRLKYEMVNYHLNILTAAGAIILLKKRVKKVKYYKFPNK